MKQLSSVGLFYGLMILGMLRAVTGTQTCSAKHRLQGRDCCREHPTPVSR